MYCCVLDAVLWIKINVTMTAVKINGISLYERKLKIATKW